MDSSIGRIPSDPTTPTSSVRPVGPRERERERGESSFEEELSEAEREAAQKRSERESDRPTDPRPPSADPDVGTQLDLTV